MNQTNPPTSLIGQILALVAAVVFLVLGFMFSEVGATQFQREMPMGVFDGRVPLGENDPAWAPELPIAQMTREVPE